MLLRWVVDEDSVHGPHNHALKTTSAEVQQCGATRQRIPESLIPFGRSMAATGLPIADIHASLVEHAQSNQLSFEWSSRDVESMFAASKDAKSFDTEGNCVSVACHQPCAPSYVFCSSGRSNLVS